MSVISFQGIYESHGLIHVIKGGEKVWCHACGRTDAYTCESGAVFWLSRICKIANLQKTTFVSVKYIGYFEPHRLLVLFAVHSFLNSSASSEAVHCISRVLTTKSKTKICREQLKCKIKRLKMGTRCIAVANQWDAAPGCPHVQVWWKIDGCSSVSKSPNPSPPGHQLSRQLSSWREHYCHYGSAGPSPFLGSASTIRVGRPVGGAL